MGVLTCLKGRKYENIFSYITEEKVFDSECQKREGISVQSLSCVQLFVTPWTSTHQASLFFTNSQSLLKLMLGKVISSQTEKKMLYFFKPSYTFFMSEIRLLEDLSQPDLHTHPPNPSQDLPLPVSSVKRIS